VFKGSQLSWKYPTIGANVGVGVTVGVAVGIGAQVLSIHISLIWMFTPTSADGNLPQ
jgi:hypothetical protein